MKDHDAFDLGSEEKHLDRELAETATMSVNAYPEYSSEFSQRLEAKLCAADGKNSKRRTATAPPKVVRVFPTKYLLPLAALLMVAVGLMTWKGEANEPGLVLFAPHGTSGMALSIGERLDASQGPIASLFDNRATVLQREHSLLEIKSPNELALVSGEVFVHVKPNSGRFVVTTPLGGRVEVIGTSFLISEVDDQVTVTTFSGKVRFSGSGSEALLAAGEKGSLSSAKSGIFKTEGNDPAPDWALSLMRNYQATSLHSLFPSTAPKD